MVILFFTYKCVVQIHGCFVVVVVIVTVVQQVVAHFVVALGSPVLELEPVAVVDLEPAVVVLLLLCGQNTAFNILTFVIVIIVIENIWHVALLPKSLPNRAAAPTTLKKFV